MIKTAVGALILITVLGIGLVFLVGGGGNSSTQTDTTVSYNQSTMVVDGTEYVAITINVENGELDMQDVWFESRLETTERHYELSHASDEIQNGVESRGIVKDGNTAVALYEVPDNADIVGWGFEEGTDITVQEQ